MNKYLVILTVLVKMNMCRDFYVGMFKKNDLLVAQDALYKEKVSFRSVYAKYGRIFKCPITYLHVADRLGIGRGPRVEIIRGGLQYKYVVLRLTSPYNYPVSVNVYVGCENKLVTRSFTRKLVVQKTTTKEAKPATSKGDESATTGTSAGNVSVASIAPAANTTG